MQKVGIEPIVGVRHYHWGKLEFVVRDPDGVIIVFLRHTQKRKQKRLMRMNPIVPCCQRDHANLFPNLTIFDTIT